MVGIRSFPFGMPCFQGLPPRSLTVRPLKVTRLLLAKAASTPNITSLSTVHILIQQGLFLAGFPTAQKIEVLIMAQAVRTIGG